MNFALGTRKHNEKVRNPKGRLWPKYMRDSMPNEEAAMAKFQQQLDIEGCTWKGAFVQTIC